MSLPKPVEALWVLEEAVDGIRLAQIRDVKRAPGFPASLGSA